MKTERLANPKGAPHVTASPPDSTQTRSFIGFVGTSHEPPVTGSAAGPPKDFLKRFTVFNLDQCEGLPEELTSIPALPDPVMAIAEADRVIAAIGADFRIGGGEAFYSPVQDYVQVPPQAAFHDPINWYRTAA